MNQSPLCELAVWTRGAMESAASPSRSLCLLASLRFSPRAFKWKCHPRTLQSERVNRLFSMRFNWMSHAKNRTFDIYFNFKNENRKGRGLTLKTGTNGWFWAGSSAACYTTSSQWSTVLLTAENGTPLTPVSASPGWSRDMCVSLGSWLPPNMTLTSGSALKGLHAGGGGGVSVITLCSLGEGGPQRERHVPPYL